MKNINLRISLKSMKMRKVTTAREKMLKRMPMMMRRMKRQRL